MSLGCRTDPNPNCMVDARAYWERTRKETECSNEKMREDLDLVEVWEWWDPVGVFVILG